MLLDWRRFTSSLKSAALLLASCFHRHLHVFEDHNISDLLWPMLSQKALLELVDRQETGLLVIDRPSLVVITILVVFF